MHAPWVAELQQACSLHVLNMCGNACCAPAVPLTVDTQGCSPCEAHCSQPGSGKTHPVIAVHQSLHRAGAKCKQTRKCRACDTLESACCSSLEI